MIVIFQLLNLSIDAPDAQPDYLPENLSINDIESIVELVLEDFFGLENAISEQDETDEESNSSLNKKIEFLSQNNYSSPLNFIIYIPISGKQIYQYNFYLSDYFTEIIQPPEV